MNIDIKQLEFIHPILREILIWMEEYFSTIFTVTSLYRVGDNGVHGTLPLRATDLRCTSDELGSYIEDRVNSLWAYDHNRPKMKVCIYHDVGRGKHLHIQVHSNTKRR